MADLPMATLTLNKQDQPVFSARCQFHGKRDRMGRWIGQKTSNYQGATEDGLMFRCPENAAHTSHLFYAQVPPDAPKSVADIDKWIASQRAERLKEVNRG